MNQNAVALIVLIVFAIFAAALGVGVYTATANHYRAEIATLQKDHADRLALQTAAAQQVERAQSDIKNRLEAGYVETSELQKSAELETSRLTLDVDLAVARLRRAGSSGAAAGLPGAAPNAGSCDDLRSANARLATALERLVGRGGGIVADGARAENIAALAARAARSFEGSR